MDDGEHDVDDEVADFGEGRLDGVDDDFALGVLLVVIVKPALFR